MCAYFIWLFVHPRPAVRPQQYQYIASLVYFCLFNLGPQKSQNNIAAGMEKCKIGIYCKRAVIGVYTYR